MQSKSFILLLSHKKKGTVLKEVWLWKPPLLISAPLWSTALEEMRHKLSHSFASSPSKQTLRSAAWDRVRISTAAHFSHSPVWLCTLASLCGSKMILLNCWTHKGCMSHCKLITASQKMSRNCQTYNYLYCIAMHLAVAPQSEWDHFSA